MSAEFTPLERRLLTTMQARFPLTRRPFVELAEELDSAEAEVLAAITDLKNEGTLRRICAIFDTHRLGYTSTLVAARVTPDQVDDVAQAVGRHPGVSHNYARDHDYNLWFTLAVPPGQDLDEQARRLVDRPGVEDWLLLPMTHRFKLRVRFDLTDDGNRREPGGDAQGESDLPEQAQPFDLQDVPLVRILQKDLPLVVQPFDALCHDTSFGAEELLAGARRLLAAGIMRRYAALVRHHRVGYGHNAMACWEVAPNRLQQAGWAAAEHAAVSHCYAREAHPPAWPYRLYTMVHARTADELQRHLDELEALIQPQRSAVLRTRQEYKKVRLRYFETPSDR